MYDCFLVYLIWDNYLSSDLLLVIVGLRFFNIEMYASVGGIC